MQSCIFPQELVDYIFDFLHDDPDTLKNCSLTCRACVPTCRSHIFRRIHLSPWGSSTCQRFCRLVKDVPSIIPLVRDLQILNGGIMWGMQGWPDDSYPWISTEESLPRVLRALQLRGNPRAFSILLKIRWIELPLILKSSICGIIRLPSLTEVDLMDCDFGRIANLDVLFRHCSGLKRIKLSQITFHSDKVDTVGENFPHAQQSDRTRPECLTIIYSEMLFIISWVLHPQAAVDVTGLRKLRCSVAPSDSREFPLFEKFFGTLRDSLEHLHLELVRGSIRGTSPCVDVNHHHHLRSLRLSFDIASHLNPLPSVTNFFSRINSDSIHEIVIDLRLEVGDETLRRETFLSLPWDDLDIALSRSAFRLLQKVDVTIYSKSDYIKYKTNRRWAVDDVKELLPRLASKGILSVYGLAYENSWFYYWPGPTWHATS